LLAIGALGFPLHVGVPVVGAAFVLLHLKYPLCVVASTVVPAVGIVAGHVHVSVTELLLAATLELLAATLELLAATLELLAAALELLATLALLRQPGLGHTLKVPLQVAVNP